MTRETGIQTILVSWKEKKLSARARICVCVCVCEREKERERGGEREGKRESESETETILVAIRILFYGFISSLNAPKHNKITDQPRGLVVRASGY